MSVLLEPFPSPESESGLAQLTELLEAKIPISRITIVAGDGERNGCSSKKGQLNLDTQFKP